jgi:hypothetical protein
LKRPLRDKKGETLIEGVCAMALLLIALSVILEAAWLAVKLMKAADYNDRAFYSPLCAVRAAEVTICVDCGGEPYTEAAFEAEMYRNSAGLVYISVGSA